MACTGDASEKCGGILKASVYAFDNDEAVDPVEPVDDFLGCFQDDRDTRILPEMQPISLDSMGATVRTLCKDLCDGQGFDYYATQFGRECWCGSGTPAETYNLYGQLTDVDCDMACTGDASEKCGGILKASVYTY
ncbi:unnamed protein product [Hapterophycus canaliculatus]